MSNSDEIAGVVCQVLFIAGPLYFAGLGLAWTMCFEKRKDVLMAMLAFGVFAPPSLLVTSYLHIVVAELTAWLVMVDIVAFLVGAYRLITEKADGPTAIPIAEDVEHGCPPSSSASGSSTSGKTRT